jgi:glycosyltransferase involved in cell wall biosynthesis
VSGTGRMNADGRVGTASRLRIEMLLPTMERAGMELVTAALGGALRERGHDVGFTCIEGIGDVGRDLAADGFRVSNVDAPGLRPNVFPRELGRWLGQVAPDVVHIHSGVWLKGAQGAHHAGVRGIVFTLHGIRPVEPWYLPWYNRLAALRTNRIVAVSESLQQYLLDVVGAPADRVQVIHNGVSTETFRPRQRSPGLRHELGVPEDAIVIGCVARLHPVKNHDLLVDAFARLRQHVPRAFLLLVGDGARRAEVEAQVARLGLHDAVRITGVLDSTAAVYNEMDVFALSSHIEGTSISILEAMAAGVPVVATAVGGNPALLGDGERGLLSPAGDAAAFAGTLLALLRDAPLRERLAERGREAVLRRYSVRSMAAAYEDAYAAALAMPRGRRPRTLATRQATPHELTGQP